MRHARYEMTDKRTDRQTRKQINNALSSSSELCLKFQVSSSSGKPTWQSFRVTWGLNILSSRTFSKLPQTEGRARSEGFARLAGECSGGKFVGHRFMKGLDTAAVIIYDDNGYVAGLQHGVRISFTLN
ncbi:hypothetical protein AVEN_254319-1 [Araneus ventricosus]|uniref:Uncharacterized protein n=1 Tax=Araneus ventricosus TaxID=182803 RepID=A0A4Y2URP8_ARAVE|nr:hypothetical protein AVEN_259127-1 [Araneus ventricosus]GBO14232.1 hypothetical protein AVEN_254319-1 [Araneus ventricosus]